MAEFRIITNNVSRLIVDASELTTKERKNFDYLNWTKLESGDESAEFFRYRGHVYSLEEFMTTYGMPEFSPLKKWDGYLADSFFSGIIVKFVDDGERVIVGTFLS